MPAGVVKTKADEKKWNEAKEQVRKQYGNVKEHYGAVMHIFQNMKKSSKSNPRPAGQRKGVKMVTGRGVGGSPRRGRPKTDAERTPTHQRRFGNTKLPPRGTGLKRKLKKKK